MKFTSTQIFLLLAFVATCSQSARACSCLFPDSFEKRFGDERHVVRARVLATFQKPRPQPETTGEGLTAIRFGVKTHYWMKRERAYKGCGIPLFFTASSSFEGTSCETSLKKDSSYVLPYIPSDDIQEVRPCSVS